MRESPEDLPRTYVRRFGGRRRYRNEVWGVLAREYFQRFVPEDGVVLDLGCGWGEFINVIRAARKLGMDLNPAAAEHLNPDVQFLLQDCSMRWGIDDESVDTVFTSNFFEHLPDKEALRRTLAEAFRCLRRGGRLVCLGPNIKCLPGAYWDFWDHFVPLTELSLREGMELAGLNVETCLRRFLPFTMATGPQVPVWLVSAYLRVPLLWRLLGRQFLLVGVKP